MQASADHRIVVLHGKESFLRGEHTRRVLDALRERFGAVDEFSFDGASCSLADVLDELRSYGLMSQHKVVVVDNSDQFMQGEDRRRAMERYAQAPMPDATLILRSAAWRPGTFDKLVAGVGSILKCEAPGAAEAIRWAVARCAKRHGVMLTGPAATALVERVGADLGRLDSELGKLAVGALAAHAGPGEAQITPTLVNEFTGLSREEQAWEIQGALLTGEPAQALQKLDELLRISRAPEVLVSWSVLELVRKVHDASLMRAAGEGDSAIAKALKLWGESLSAVLTASHRVSPVRAAQLLQSAIAADRRMKNGQSPDPERALEALSVQIAGGLVNDRRKPMV